MPHIFQSIQNQTLATLALLFAALVGQAQNPFPTSGFTLPNGKSIVITYEVTVNANACPTGTVPLGNLANQSQVQGTNFSTVNTDDPDVAGGSDHTVTPFGAITIGNLVYNDINRDGDYDDGIDAPLNGVALNLYVDNGDGVLTAADGAAIGNTTSASGAYAFNVCPGNYIVEVAPSNFAMGGALYNSGAPYVSSPIGGAPDPDANTIDSDDNGDPVSGFGVATAAFTVAYNANPMLTSEYNHIDLGFKTPTTVNINNVTLNEGTGGGPTAFNFTVTRSDNSEAFTLTVNTSAGTATGGTDFTAISGGTVSFTAGGSTDATVTVNVAHDNIVENNETFFVNLSGAPVGVIITDGTGDGIINNDDNATVTLSGGIAQDEGNAGTTTFTFTATLNNPVQGGFTVPYTTGGGTATAGADYTDNDGTLTFAGSANETQTWTVNVNGDVTVELNETFEGALGAIAGAPSGVSTASTPQTATITNDDAAVVSIAANVSQSEAITPMPFSITLSNPVDVAVTVIFGSIAGTATVGADYTSLSGASVIFPANSTTAQTLNAAIVNETIVEADETFSVTIGTVFAMSRNVSGGGSRTGTILNDDAATVTLSPVGGVTQNEGNSGVANFVFTATLDNPVQGGFTLGFSTMDGTATSPSDYAGVSGGSLTFLGNAAEFQNISIGVNGDLDIENTETFTVNLGTVTALTTVQTNAISTAGSPKTGTIVNDEQDWGDAPTAAQSGFASSYPTTLVNNGARHTATPGGLRLGATIDGDLDGQPNATATGDGADEDGVTLPSSFVLNTAANITVNASAAGRLDAWFDWNRDGDWSDAGEQVFTNLSVTAGNNTLSVSTPIGASIGASFARFRLSTAGGLATTGLAADGEVEDYQINIQNVALSINDATLMETNSGTTNAVFTVSLNNPAPAGGVTFDIATVDGTATTGNNDYVAQSLSNQIISAGMTNYTFTVVVNGDIIVEPDETFFVNVTNVVGAGVTDAQGLGTITNDDAAAVTLSGGIAQNEGNSGTISYVFTATLNNPVQGGFTVPYTTGGGAATSGTDYTDNDGTLTFAGNANETQSWTVNVNGDVTVELNETFEGALGALAGAPAGVTTAGTPQTGTITNDDAAVVNIQSDISQLENAGNQVFSITLSNPVDVPVMVNLSTSNIAPTTSADLTLVTTSVTFSAGSTTAQNATVNITNDMIVEPNEMYTLNLGSISATGRDVTPGTNTVRNGTIENDDNATITLSGGGVANEGNTGTTSRVFTATLNNPVQGAFTVAYTTSDGTATTANNDYVDNDGSLSFIGTAGEAKTITVLANGDFFVEADETYTVALGAVTSPLSGSISLAGSPQTGTLNNDEIDYGDIDDVPGLGAPFISTLLTNNGARHNATLTGPRLGAAIDGDPDGQASFNANGDDLDAEGDDEDGVVLPNPLVKGTMTNVTVTASAAGVLNGWVDFESDFSFDQPGNQVFTNVPVTAGINNLSFMVPVAASTTSNAYARFRISTASGLTPYGLAADGEVEDYQTSIIENQFSIDDPSVTEGNSGTANLVFTVSCSTNATASSVDYAVTGGTATSGTDYVPLAAGTINFTSGGPLTQTITITVNGDLIVENNETIIVTLSNPVNGVFGDNTGTGTITNDDAAVVTLSGGVAQNEGNSGTTSYVFTATLNNPVQGGFTVPYTTGGGTATAGTDYTDNDGTLTFAGNANETQSWTVNVNGDVTVELNETFEGALGAISGAPAGVTTAGSPQTGTITNDDAAVVSLVGNVLQAENLSPQVFNVTLSNPVDVAVTVLFNTSNGTATVADNDYTPVVNQTVTFLAGSTAAQSVSVTINNDNKVEANEVYNVALGSLNASGRNVTLGTSAGTGTITNDDAAVVTLSGGSMLNEGNTGTTPFVFTATLNNPVQGGFTVPYTTTTAWPRRPTTITRTTTVH